jgi:hypothetical protein
MWPQAALIIKIQCNEISVFAHCIFNICMLMNYEASWELGPGGTSSTFLIVLCVVPCIYLRSVQVGCAPRVNHAATSCTDNKNTIQCNEISVFAHCIFNICMLMNYEASWELGPGGTSSTFLIVLCSFVSTKTKSMCHHVIVYFLDYHHSPSAFYCYGFPCTLSTSTVLEFINSLMEHYFDLQ